MRRVGRTICLAHILCSIKCVLAVGILMLGACRTTVPIHVWHPPKVSAPKQARIALAAVAGPEELALRIENAMLSQRPAARADLAIITRDQLFHQSPVRLASTATLSSELTSVQAARAADADYLLQGQILRAKIDLENVPVQTQPKNWNNLYFQQRDEQEIPHEEILISWRVIDAETSETLGYHSFTLRSHEAAEKYPDLWATDQDPSLALVESSARESWHLLAPVVIEDQVRLAVPWLQPGSWFVRRGVRAAKEGDWQTAEARWKTATKYFWFNAPAKHNLAVAYAARENFTAAKEQLRKARGPLATRLPRETLLWLDQNHRLYNEAHGLAKPPEGWAFPQPDQNGIIVQDAPPIAPEDLPWWTAIPLIKPPGWTWWDWIRQPVVF